MCPVQLRPGLVPTAFRPSTAALNNAVHRSNGFIVGSAGDQWISPGGTDHLKGIVKGTDNWQSFLQVLPILVILSTAVVVGLAHVDAKLESRVPALALSPC